MTKEAQKKPKKPTTLKTHKKVFDVVRPGKAPASPTSRPVIASHKPPVADDQFVPGAPTLRASDPAAKHDLLDGKKKKELAPLGGAPSLPDAPAVVSAEPAPQESVVKADALSSGTPAATAAVAAVQPEPAPASDTSTPSAPLPPASAPESDAVSVGQEQPDLQQIQPDDFAAQPPTEEETPAHLAMEQTVQTDPEVPIWEHPATSTQVEASSESAPQRQGSSKSIEDLLAETGAPMLENEQTPSMIVSHHKPHSQVWKILLVFVSVLILAVVAIDLLLDAGVITTGANVPYTDFL